MWWLALSCWIHMYDHVILVRGEVWAHQSSLTLSRNESRRFGALKSDSTHHFYRHACTKSESQFSQFSGCWLILFVYIIMSFDFPFVRLFGVRWFWYYPYSHCFYCSTYTKPGKVSSFICVRVFAYSIGFMLVATM